MINAIVVTAVINAIVNGAIAWISAIGRPRVPLWATPILGGPSTLTDAAGTLVLLPLITTVILTAVIRLELRRGRLTPLICRGGVETLRRYLPARAGARGLVLGVICVAVLGPPILAALIAFDFGDISVGAFVLSKAIFGVILGAVVTPLIAVLATASAPEGRWAGDARTPGFNAR